MSSSSTSVPACPAPEEQQDQNGPAKPAEAQSRLQEHIATAEALDAQLEAASRRDSARVPVHTDSAKGIPDPERHSRKCKICRHRDRDVIEADFIEWCHPSQICEDYKISYRALYRHATATGLLERRRENVCIVVHKLLEEVEYVENPSAFAILRAVRTLASLDSRDRWAEPHTTHVVVNATEPPAESANPVTVSGPVESRSSGLATRRPPRRASAVALVSVPPCLSASGSNRHTYEKLEVPVTAIMYLTQKRFFGSLCIRGCHETHRCHATV